MSAALNDWKVAQTFVILNESKRSFRWHQHIQFMHKTGRKWEIKVYNNIMIWFICTHLNFGIWLKAMQSQWVRTNTAQCTQQIRLVCVHISIGRSMCSTQNVRKCSFNWLSLLLVPRVTLFPPFRSHHGFCWALSFAQFIYVYKTHLITANTPIPNVFSSLPSVWPLRALISESFFSPFSFITLFRALFCNKENKLNK